MRGSTPLGSARLESERSFDDLYRRHRSELYRFLLRRLRDKEDAEDVTQAAFLNAYVAMERGHRPEQPRAWLFAIAKNVVRRRVRGHRPIEVPLAEDLESAGIEETVSADEIAGALEKLPLSQREALALRELVGLTYAEIAEQLDTSVQSVQMLLFRARRTLREDLASVRRLATLPAPSWIASLLTTSDKAGLATRAAAVVAGAAVLGGTVAGGERASRPVNSPAPLARSAVLAPAGRPEPSRPAASVARRTSPDRAAARRQAARTVPPPAAVPEGSVATAPATEQPAQAPATVPSVPLRVGVPPVALPEPPTIPELPEPPEILRPPQLPELPPLPPLPPPPGPLP